MLKSDWGTLINDKILVPLGMNHTGTTIDSKVMKMEEMRIESEEM